MKRQQSGKTEERTLTRPEIEELVGRVGGIYAKRLEWAFNFAQDDSKNWTSGDWENRRLELSVFVEIATQPDLPRPLPIPEKQALAVLSSRDVSEAQRLFRSVLEKFQKSPKVEIGAFAIGYELRVADSVYREWAARGKKDLDLVMLNFLDDGVRFYGSNGQLALLRFAQLFSLLRGQVLRCPDRTCGRWFVALRSNQEYCSRAHAMRSAKRAQRDRQARASRPGRGRKPRRKSRQ